MASFKPLGNHPAMSKYISETLWRPTSLPEPFRGASNLDVFRAVIDDGRQFLPERYHDPYVNVLEAALNQAESSLSQPSTRSRTKRSALIAQLESVFSVLAAPIVQLRSSKHQREIKAFLSLASNVYRRFVDDERVRKADSESLSDPDLDPLAFFGSNAAGPFTLAASRELPVTLVSKPASQLNCVPLWLTDGHEIGGHGLITAVKGLEREVSQNIETAIRQAAARGVIKGARNSVRLPAKGSLVFDSRRAINFEQFLVELFAAWNAELIADAAGVLNLGPFFVDCGMLVLENSRSGGGLNLSSEYDSRTGFSQHPLDLIRVLLAIEMVRKLKLKEREIYASALQERLLSILGGTLPQTIAWLKPSGNKLVELPLEHLRSALPVVADAILNSPLTCLSKQPLSNLMSWSDDDEKTTRAAAELLSAGNAEIDETAEARHIVAASLLAVERASTRNDFRKIADRVHATSLIALAAIYDSQCLLCAVPTRRTGKPATATTLSDLLRLIKDVKGRQS